MYSTSVDEYYYHFLYMKVAYEYDRSKVLGDHTLFTGYLISGDLNINQETTRNKIIYAD